MNNGHIAAPRKSQSPDAMPPPISGSLYTRARETVGLALGESVSSKTPAISGQTAFQDAPFMGDTSCMLAVSVGGWVGSVVWCRDEAKKRQQPQSQFSDHATRHTTCEGPRMDESVARANA